MYSPLWKIIHQNSSVSCTPPFEKSPNSTHRFCVLPPLKKHPSKPIGFVYSPLWKITQLNPSVLYTPPFEKSLFLVGAHFRVGAHFGTYTFSFKVSCIFFMTYLSFSIFLKENCSWTASCSTRYFSRIMDACCSSSRLSRSLRCSWSCRSCEKERDITHMSNMETKSCRFVGGKTRHFSIIISPRMPDHQSKAQWSLEQSAPAKLYHN